MEIDVAVVLTEVKKGFVREAAAVRQLNILEDQTKVELVTSKCNLVLSMETPSGKQPASLYPTPAHRGLLPIGARKINWLCLCLYGRVLRRCGRT